MLFLVPMSLRPVRRALPIWALFFVFVSARAAPEQVAGTLPEDYLPGLKDILQTAAKQSHQVLAHEIEIEQNEARMMSVDAQRLPSLGGDFYLARNQTAVSDNTNSRSNDTGFFYNFGVNQAVFRWGTLKHDS